MKTISLFVLAALILFAGCDVVRPDSDQGLWATAPTAVNNMNLSNIGQSSSSLSLAASRQLPNENRIFFRSSDVEFWSFESLSDIENLYSSKYGIGSGELADYDGGQSLEYILGDRIESVVFSPDEDTASTLGVGMNPYWETRSERFISVGNTSINLIRLDIGGGNVTFIIDGLERQMLTVHGEAFTGINANSILFVDRSFLSRAYLASRDISQGIIDGISNAGDLGLSDEDFATISTLVSQSNWHDQVSPMDVDGALFIPASPIDLAGFDPLSQHLALELSWPIAGAIQFNGVGYYVDNRVGDSPFDFDLTLKIMDGPSVDGQETGDYAGY